MLLVLIIIREEIMDINVKIQNSTFIQYCTVYSTSEVNEYYLFSFSREVTLGTEVYVTR